MEAAPYPPARSFRPRRRGLPPARALRYEALFAQWSLPIAGDVLDLHALFGPMDVVLDIGFGGGEGLVEMATARSDEAIIGVEVHTPGVATVLEAIDANNWQNIRVVHGDALELLPRLAPGSLAGVRIYFPDPWLKNKQKHRRLARPDVVTALVDRLRIGGTLHLATDIPEYAAQAHVVCLAEPRLAGGVVPRPSWRPETRFERRGLAAGRHPTDLLYERVI